MCQVAGLGFAVQLVCDQPIPGCGDGILRSRQHKEERAVGHACEAATLQAAGADGLEGEHPEQFTEPIDGLVQQGADGFRAAVASSEACSATGDHNVNGGIDDPLADRCSDPIAVVRTDCAAVQVMTSSQQAFLQQVSTWIGVQGSTVGNRQQGNGQHAALMGGLIGNARTVMVSQCRDECVAA